MWRSRARARTAWLDGMISWGKVTEYGFRSSGSAYSSLVLERPLHFHQRHFLITGQASGDVFDCGESERRIERFTRQRRHQLEAPESSGSCRALALGVQAATESLSRP